MSYPKIFHDNRFADATPVASTTASGYSVLNLRDWRPVTRWKPTALPATVTVDCGSSRTADYALIYGHSLFSSRCAVHVLGSSDNFATSETIGTSNLIEHSQELDNANWSKFQATVSANVARAPDGTWTADKLTETTANNDHGADYLSAALTNRYCVARYRLKAAERTLARVHLYDVTANVFAQADVNLSAGTVTPAIGTASISALGDGWYEVRLASSVTNQAGTIRTRIYIGKSGEPDPFLYAGDGSSGIYVGGVSLHHGDQSLVSVYQNTSGAEQSPILLTFPTKTYRYWRFDIRSSSGTAVMPSLAIASVGAALEIPATMDDGFDPMGREAIGQQNRSAEGHPLGSVIAYERFRDRLKFSLVNGTAGWSWLRSSFLPAWRAHLSAKPFGFAWDPGAYSDEFWLLESDGGKFDAPHKSGGYCDLMLPVNGIFHE